MRIGTRLGKWYGGHAYSEKRRLRSGLTSALAAKSGPRLDLSYRQLSIVSTIC
jgi:hypothetical protein